MPRPRKLKPEWFCFLDGHSASVGDGWRAISVVKLGTKWAHLCATGTQEMFRVPLAKWENTRKRPVLKGKIQFETAEVPLTNPLAPERGRKKS